MRVDLDPRSSGAPSWPARLDVRTFTPEDARSLHSLIEHSYRAGGGSVAAFDAWFADRPAMRSPTLLCGSSPSIARGRSARSCAGRAGS